tara:strand:- start:2837 stop:3802 length:966 start_codon:yes stop_codon:yes gene_type:complete
MNDLMKQCERAAQSIVAAYGDRFWAARDAVNKGTPPPAPDYSDSAAKGIETDIRTLPARKIIESLAKSGGKGRVQVGGEWIDVDFTGFGDLDQMQIDLEAMRTSADAIAAMNLDIQQRYGEQMNLEQLKRIKEADPVGYELRQKLAQTTLEELSAGRELGDDAARQVEQSVRGAQSARGNVYGSANIGQEALAKFDAGQRLLTQRMSQAQAYALGTPITAQYGAISGAQQGAANFAPMQLQQGIAQNPNAAGQAAQFASSNYSTYVQGLQNQTNPWMEGLGMVAGVAAQAAGGHFAGKAMAGAGGGIGGYGFRLPAGQQVA